MNIITVVKKIDPNKVDKNIIRVAGALLFAGQLVAFPTETVYGLGADALMVEGAKNIYAAKGRPSDNPLIVHIADFDDLAKIVKEVPREAKLFPMRRPAGWIRWQCVCPTIRWRWH